MLSVNKIQNQEINKCFTQPKAFEEFWEEPVWVMSDPNGKPMQSDGQFAKCNDSSTWQLFSKIAVRCKGGVLPAICLSKQSHLIFIDLDHVRNPQTEEILPWANQLINEANSYTEISRSGTGIHIFLRGQPPILENEALRFKASNIQGTASDIEIYYERKFATISGNVFLDVPIKEATEKEILQIYRTFFPILKNQSIHAQEYRQSPEMTNEEVVKRARNAKNGKRFRDLYDLGDWNERYGSASEADMGMISMLSFYTQNEKQLLELLNASALRRTKWKERKDYLPNLVKKVLCTMKVTYQSPSMRMKISANEILKEENPCEGFSLDLFPSTVTEYVSSITDHCEAHPITTLGTVLSVASSYGSKCYIDYFGKLYPNTYQLNLRASGGAKSTALNMGASHALKRERETAEQFKQQLEIAQLGDRKDEQKLIKEALKQRAGLSRLMAPRTTAQRLFSDLSNGHRGVVLVSEFGGWLADLEATYNATLKATLTELYDCPEYFEVRLKGNLQSPEILINPFFGLMGVCTPEWIEGQLKSDDILKGFLARFLIFWIKQKPKKPRALPTKWVPPESLKIALEKAERFEGEYFLHEEAKIVFTTIYDHIWDNFLNDFPREEQFAIIEPFIKRWIPGILKIALTLHLIENPENRHIEAKHIHSAAYYVGFAISSTLHLLKSGLLDSKFDRDCQLVLKFVAKKGGTVKRKDLLKSKRLKVGREYGGVQLYENVLSFLAESGQLVCKECPKKNEWEYSLAVEGGEKT